jgi:hypothetical protein
MSESLEGFYSNLLGITTLGKSLQSSVTARAKK